MDDHPHARTDATSQTGAKRKVPKWLLAGLGVFFAAILTAGGTWVFNSLTGALSGGKAPFNANLSDYSDECEGFVIDRALLDEVELDGDSSIDEEWVAANGGLQAGPRLIQLSLVGSTESAVAINAITLTDVTEHALPGDPIVILECSPRGGDLADHSLHLDFASSSVSISSPESGQLDFPFRIDAGDPEVFAVTTTPADGGEAGCFCTWRLRVHWTSGSADGEEVVDIDGAAVAVVDARPYPVYWLEEDQWVTY